MIKAIMGKKAVILAIGVGIKEIAVGEDEEEAYSESLYGDVSAKLEQGAKFEGLTKGFSEADLRELARVTTASSSGLQIMDIDMLACSFAGVSPFSLIGENPGVLKLAQKTIKEAGLKDLSGIRMRISMPALL